MVDLLLLTQPPLSPFPKMFQTNKFNKGTGWDNESKRTGVRWSGGTCPMPVTCSSFQVQVVHFTSSQGWSMMTRDSEHCWNPLHEENTPTVNSNLEPFQCCWRNIDSSNKSNLVSGNLRRYQSNAKHYKHPRRKVCAGNFLTMKIMYKFVHNKSIDLFYI